MRKLVQLDDETWGWTKIDPVRLRRVAQVFKAWLTTVDPHDDPFGFLEQDLPLVEAALRGNLPLPFKGGEPHTREIGEGWLPKRYAWADFEEPLRGAIRSATKAHPLASASQGEHFSASHEHRERVRQRRRAKRHPRG